MLVSYTLLFLVTSKFSSYVRIYGKKIALNLEKCPECY